MKVKRHKLVRKYCQFYKLNYHIRPPYKILLDSEFLQAAIEGRIQLKEQIPKLMMEEVMLCTTRCIVEDLRKRGIKFKGAHQIANRCKFLTCMHERKYNEAGTCIQKLCMNKNRGKLLIGTCSTENKSTLRNMPGIPILSIHGNVVFMEAPSDASKQGHLDETNAKLTQLNDGENAVLGKLDGKKKNVSAIVHVAKKVKGPNPLSMKKKKKVLAAERKERLKRKTMDIVADAQAATPNNVPSTTTTLASGKKPRKRRRKNSATVEKMPSSTTVDAPSDSSD